MTTNDVSHISRSSTAIKGSFGGDKIAAIRPVSELLDEDAVTRTYQDEKTSLWNA